MHDISLKRRLLKIKSAISWPFLFLVVFVVEGLQILLWPLGIHEFFRGHAYRYVSFLGTERGILWNFDGPEVIKRVKLTYFKEQDTVAWIEGIPENETFWDIGANIGMFSMLAGSRSINTVAFEPQAENFALLYKNIYVNGLEETIQALPIALFDKEAVADLTISSREPGSAMNIFSTSRIEGVATGMTQAALSMRGDRLVELGLSNPKFIKLDVDGNELNVLLGLSGVLKDVSEVLVEMNKEDKASFDGICNFMTSAGFQNDVVKQTSKYQNFIFKRI